MKMKIILLLQLYLRTCNIAFLRCNLCILDINLIVVFCPSGDLKRRHSWSSEVDYQPAETEAVTVSREDPGDARVPSDDDRISYKVSDFIL